MTLRLKSGLLLVCLTSACDQFSEPSTDKAEHSAVALSRPQYASFETYWALPSPDEVAERARALAEILTNKTLPSAPFLSQAQKSVGEARNWRGLVLDGVGINYYPAQDDLRVSLPDLRKESLEDLTRKGLGADEAQAIFLSTYEKLVSRGLVDGRHFDVKNVKVATTVFSVGAVGVSEPPREAITEYNMTMMRQINGVPFANSGVKVSVRTTGQVVEIRVGGASLKSQFVSSAEVPDVHLNQRNDGGSQSLVELPSGAGEIFDGSADTEQFQAAFARQFPQGRADWSELIYMLPMGRLSEAGILEPRYVVSFSELHDGVASRRKYVGFSVRDGSTADLSEVPDPNSQGDARVQ